MAKSTAQVLVYEMPELKPHDNATSLSLVEVGGYQVVVRTENWKDSKLCAYIPPDNTVDTTRPEFKFLDKYGTQKRERIRACKLQGKVSFGLLVPAPADSKVGDDVTELLGVEHYEPQIRGEGLTRGDNEEDIHPVYGNFYKYDVEALRRYKNAFKERELVNLREKIHGANSRYVFHDNKMYVGSRTFWKKYDEKSGWWIAFANTPSIQQFCMANPGYCLYGEIYGQVQDLKYGVGPERVRFAAFDIVDTSGRYLNVTEFEDKCKEFGVPVAPLIANYFPFNFEQIEKMAECDSLLCPGQLMEGIVVKSMEEGWDQDCGRKILKIVSSRYLMS